MHENPSSDTQVTRRSFLKRGGLAAVFVALVGEGYAMLRSLVPNVLYERPKQVKVGRPQDFEEGGTFLEEYNLFVFKEAGTIYSISSVCTHLGCNVKMRPLPKPRTVELGGKRISETFEFACPCHGSLFHSDGSVIKGPAPKALPRFYVALSPKDGQIVVDTGRQVDAEFRLSLSA